MRKTVCFRCKGTYDVGFYAQHRTTEEHTKVISVRQARYGGPTTICDHCKQGYPTGEYGKHAAFDKHHRAATVAGLRAVRRQMAIASRKDRDEAIASAIKSGDSYGEIATRHHMTRQRVHQIAQKMGLTSRSYRKTGGVSVIGRTCFYDNAIYSVWDVHSKSKAHIEAVDEFKRRISRFHLSPEGD